MTDPESSKTLRRLGIIAVLLGFLAACDTGYEITKFGFARAAVAVEFGLALIAIVSGLALLQRRPWAMKVSVVAAVAGFFHSVLVLVTVGPSLMRILTILGMDSMEDRHLRIEFGVRLILTAAQALFWPLVLGLLWIDLQCRPADDPAAPSDKRTFWTSGVAAVVFATVLEVLLMVWRTPQPH